MNRLRIVTIVSAMVGSTAGFLVLSRWRLAGTVTGAFVLPAIYTLVSHCSHETLEHLRRWTRRRLGKTIESEPDDSPKADERPAPQDHRPAGRMLQWTVATLAFVALAVSVYSLTQSDPGTTILRERVVQTVTVTSDPSMLSLAHSGVSNAAGALGASDSVTTTAVSGQGGGDPSATTVSTVAGPGDGSTPVTQPPGTTTTLP